MIFKDNSDLNWAHPLVKDWFKAKFNSPTEPQQEGWPEILAGKETLISAPTGSGKTFAAFLVCLNQILTKALRGELRDETEVVYISPLKALGNDVQKNLLTPLAEIKALANERGILLPEIRVAVRTGDTLARERQAMLKKPPHILITTPESIYILLTADKSRAMLVTVKTVIVDEIHALVGDKRGAHLMLSLERLDALAIKKPLRIGLSATQKPMNVVASFLTGKENFKKVAIIDKGHARVLDIAIEIPDSELGAVASNEMWDEIYARLATLAKNERSTLVFVNTRRLAERVAHHLAEHLGEDQVAAHHGSLSRKLRLQAETKLKNGNLKVLVATASLELGIDIGTIDLVCQLGSPRAIAVALQRIGRAGHMYGAIPKGRIFATTRDELLECAALLYAIKTGDLDQLIIPQQPLDILAQQIVAICATGEWQEDALYQLVKRAYPYRQLTRETFDTILEMLSEGIAASRGRFGAYLFRDRVHHIVRARRGSRLTAITSGGAIPENGLFTVIAEPADVMVGTLDEDFAVESNRGDIILLGNTSWQITRIDSKTGRVYVVDAHGAPPSVPFWRGEAASRTIELSAHVATLRQTISAKLTDCMRPISEQINDDAISNLIMWLQSQCGVGQRGSEQLLEYLRQGKGLLGAIPTQKTIIAERFFDESGGMQLIIHAPFGARINKAWGLALRKKFCRSFNFELQAAATDNGINIALAEQHSFPLTDVFHFLHPNSIKDVLIQAVLPSPIFAARWRWDAMRSLALVRFRNGKKVPPAILRMLADDLLAAIFPDAAACQDNLAGRDIALPDHPLINETMKDVLTEALDLEGLIGVLKGMQDGSIQCLAVDTPTPSPFSHEILNANPYAFLDDAPLEERRARAVEMRRILPESLLQEVGKLDQAAIAEVKEEIWPDVRSADELHDMLQTVIAFTPNMQFADNPSLSPTWQPYLLELMQSGRANIAIYQHKSFWVAIERSEAFNMLYPEAIWQQHMISVAQKKQTLDETLLMVLRGWLLQIGPVTSQELSATLLLDEQMLNQALIKLETTGFILRGSFRTTQQQTEWCERRLLSRIHRLTIGRLRKEIEPVSPQQFTRWLLTWQHVTPDTKVRGIQGLLQIIKQLQGFELPANSWEKEIFAKRVFDYQQDMLDQLCLTGVVGWGRLSLHPATLDETSKRRIKPSSIVPITFFMREEIHSLYPESQQDEVTLIHLSHTAKAIHAYLQQKGASFFADIMRGVSYLKSEVEAALWELVAAGLITADGFDNLRALIDPRRRLGKKGRRRLFPSLTAGRWSLLHRDETIDVIVQHEAICRQLLQRYGVVFRDLLAREKNLPSWRDLLVMLRRLEDRGEVRGGRFVSGFLGEQFALPLAIESLRASKQKGFTGEIVTLSVSDPLNLVGIIMPGTRKSSGGRSFFSLQDGLPLNN